MAGKISFPHGNDWGVIGPEGDHDLPVDSTVNEAEFVYPEINIRCYRVQAAPPIDRKAIERVAEAIKVSKKPVIYAGAGVIHSGAASELAELARKAKIPVTTSLLGLGGFPESDPLSLGMARVPIA